MTIRVLAIGDLANCFVDLREYVKKSKIHIINFPWSTASKLTESGDVEFFDSLKIAHQVDKINSIKDDYDLAIVNTWAGARLAYLAGLDYIMLFVGSALRVPPFIKNPTLNYLDRSLPTLNIFERKFYRNILDNAILCGANEIDLYGILQKYRKKDIFLMRNIVDVRRFKENLQPINWKKTKFTFISPQRIGLAKGIDIIWKAIELTKTDFEVLQVEWFLGQRTDEERNINKNLVRNKPKKVRLIPVIKREDVPSVYSFSDGVIGQMRSGLTANVEREGVMCKKPVIQYADPNIKYKIDGKNENSSFLPHSNDPKIIAELIDKIVISKEFREKLAEEEYNFVKKIGDPNFIANEWEKLFSKVMDMKRTHKRSKFKLKINLYYFLLINRLYIKKIRKVFQ